MRVWGSRVPARVARGAGARRAGAPLREREALGMDRRHARAAFARRAVEALACGREAGDAAVMAGPRARGGAGIVPHGEGCGGLAPMVEA